MDALDHDQARAHRKRNEDCFAQCEAGTLRLSWAKAFGPHYYRKDGHWYLGASPSPKSVQRLKKTRVAEIMVPSNVAPWGMTYTPG